jgi:hypothetical protein
VFAISYTLQFGMCIIMPKGEYLLIMGRFNRGLVLNKFSMDMIKYGWNILSIHTK